MAIKLSQEDLYKGIRRLVDIDEVHLEKVMEALGQVVSKELLASKEVKIPGLCFFNVKHLNACVLKVRGKEVQVPSRKSVNVRPTDKLIKTVQEGLCNNQPAT